MCPYHVPLPKGEETEIDMENMKVAKQKFILEKINRSFLVDCSKAAPSSRYIGECHHSSATVPSDTITLLSLHREITNS